MADGVVERSHIAPELDTSLFRLSLTPLSSRGVCLRWWFPPGNPGARGTQRRLRRHGARRRERRGVWRGANGDTSVRREVS